MTHQNEDIVAREISKNDKDDDNSESFIEKKLIGLCLRLLKDIKAKSLNNDSFVTVENSQRNLLYFKNLSFSKETGIFTLSDLKLNRNLKLSDLLHSESLSEWNSHVESVNVSIVSSPIFKKCTNHLRLHSSLSSCWKVTTYSIFSDYISSMNNIKHFCSLHYVNQKIENCPIEIGPELFDLKITESIYPLQSKQGSNKKCNSHQNISKNRNKESNSASEKLEYHGLLEKLLSSHEAVTILNQVKEGEEKIKELDFNHQNSPNNKEKNKRGILERLLSPANDDLSQKELSKLKTTSWLLSNQNSVIASDKLKKIRKLSSYEKPNYDTLVSLKRSRHATTPGAIYQSQSLPGKAPSCKGSFSENDGKSSLAELLSDESNMNESANSNDSNQRIYKSTLLYGNQNCVSKQCTSQRHKGAILAANTVMKIASELSKKQEHSQDLINVRERLLSKQAVIPLSNQSTGLDDGESKLSDDGSTSGENMAAYDHENHVPGNIHHYKKNYGGKDELNDDESLISANNIKSVLKEIAPNRVLTKSDASNRTHLTLIMPKKENSAKSRIDTSKPIKEKSRLPPITKSSPYQILLPNTQTIYQIVKPISQSYNQSTTYSFPRIISLPISSTSMAETNLTPSTSTEMPIIIYEPVINATHKNTIKRNQPLSNQENSSILSNNSRVVQTNMSSNEIYNTPMDTSLVSSPPIDMIVNTVLDLEQEIYSDPKETDTNIEKAATQFFKLPSLSAICKLPT